MYIQSCWYFRPSFVKCTVLSLLPFSPSLWFTITPPPPLLVWISSEYVRIQCVRGGGRGTVSGCVIEHILQKFYTLYLTRFSTYKIAGPPQLKPRKGGDLRHKNTCRKVFLHVIFLRWRHFALPSMSLIFLLVQKSCKIVAQQFSFAFIIKSMRTEQSDDPWILGSVIKNKWTQILPVSCI